MKLSEEAYNLISEVLETEANNLESNDPRRKEIEQALEEVEAIGTY
jgi:hypothetical protein